MEEAPQLQVTNPRRSSNSSQKLVTRRALGLRNWKKAKMAALPEPPLKQVMKYAVPTVLALVMLRHQRQPDALFTENRALVWSFVAAAAVYWIIAGEMRVRKRRQVFMRRAALVLGIHCGLSLLSMILPPPLPFSLLPLLVSVLVALFFGYTWIRSQVVNLIDKICALVVWNKGIDSTISRSHV